MNCGSISSELNSVRVNGGSISSELNGVRVNGGSKSRELKGGDAVYLHRVSQAGTTLFFFFMDSTRHRLAFLDQASVCARARIGMCILLTLHTTLCSYLHRPVVFLRGKDASSKDCIPC